MSTEQVSSNLKYLCARQKSVSHVCRQLGINRQQFGRYLSGTHRPSVYNLTRICQFFSVSVDEIVLPHEQFRQRQVQSPLPVDQPGFPAEISQELLKIGSRPMPELADYVGAYFRYYFAFGFPGYVFKTLTVVRKVGQYYCTKHIERIPRHNAPTHTPLTFKYNGVLLYFCGRLFLVEHECSVQGAISHTVFAPIFRPGKRILSGVGCSIASSAGNDPSAARSVLEHLGVEIDARTALRSCGLFRPTDHAIDPHILSMIDNRNKKKEHTFRAHRG